LILVGIASIANLNSGMKIDPNSVFGKTVVAIEPGTEWFKLVRVTRGPKGPVIDKVLLKRADEVEGLAGPGFLKAMGLSDMEGVPVVVCLPRQMVNVRLFDLPSGDPQEIADMVDLQIARQTPYSREEIVFDYRLFRSDKEGYTRVMLVIAQTGVARQKYRLMEESGFQVGLLTVTTDGWLSGLQAGAMGFPQPASGAVAYWDIDSASSELVVLSQGIPLFSRSISTGMTHLTEIDRQVERCVQDVGRALETFRNETPAVPVTSLVLSGAAGRLPALATGLRTALKMEVVLATGIERLADDHLTPPMKGVSLAGVLGAAAGVAGLQVNLTPESVLLRKAVIIKARRLTLLAILAIAVSSLVSLFVMSRIDRQETYLAELNRLTKETAPRAEKIAAMQRKVAIVTERLGSRMMPVKVLAELYAVTGEGTSYSAIELNDAAPQLVLRGTTEALADTVRLVNAMESSPLFQNVKSTRTVSGKDRTEFEITCEFERKRP